MESLEPRTLLDGSLVISEFMAVNDRTLADADGEFSDWIEIHNPTPQPVDVDGWFLSDDDGNLSKWALPDVRIASGDYLLVFASGKNRAASRGELHTNFKLDGDGEFLALVMPDGATVAHAFSPDYPVQRADVSYGVAEESPGVLVSKFYPTPTPAAANSAGVAGLVDAVELSVERGLFDAPFTLEMTTTTPDARIIYTTNGRPPSARDQVYRGPITVDQTTTIRAIALKDDFLASNIATRTFIFPGDIAGQDAQFTLSSGFSSNWNGTSPDYGVDARVISPNPGQFVDALKAIPTLSIVMDAADLFSANGIYANPSQSGFAWERPTSFELIYPDGREGFQVDAGVRIQGGAFRSHGLTKKKSFRLAFREEYGPTKLNFPFFGPDAADRFDTIILRANNNDGWQWNAAGAKPQYIRDEFARATQIAMGPGGSHGNFMHLYINGVYWGLYNPVERPDASFSSSYFGGDKDEWDGLNSGNPINGDTAAWNQLVSLAGAVNTGNQTASNAAYQRLLGNNPDGTNNPAFEQMLDVDHMIDYMIVNLYGGNTDWPHKNYYVGRQRGPDSTGYKFYAWDSEWSLTIRSDVNTDRTGVNNGVAQVYGLLRANAEYRMLFADHLHRHFFNGGALYVDPANPAWDPDHPERNVPAALYKSLADQIELAIIGESARWGDQHRSTPYTQADWISERDMMLNDYFPRRSAIVLDQFRAARLYPSVTAPTFNQHGGTVAAGFELEMDAGREVVYYTLDGSDPRLPGEAINPNALLYDGATPLTASAQVKSRTRDARGGWSALNEATFLVETPPQLRISELMYHPAAPGPGEAFSENDFEFLEVVNIGAEPMELAGVEISGGVQFTFPAMTLAPGEHLVVPGDMDAFAARYGAGPRVAGAFTGNLSNGGERLVLAGAFGEPILDFIYSDAWQPSTDGSGRSLVIRDAGGDPASWGDAASWRPSTQMGGSPGAADVVIEPLVGDTNDDGLVDLADLNNVRNNFGGDGLGDTNNDGLVDLADLNNVRNNFGAERLAAPAPSAPLAAPLALDPRASVALDVVASSVITSIAAPRVAPTADDLTPAPLPDGRHAPPTPTSDGAMMGKLAQALRSVAADRPALSASGRDWIFTPLAPAEDDPLSRRSSRGHAATPRPWDEALLKLLAEEE